MIKDAIKLNIFPSTIDASYINVIEKIEPNKYNIYIGELVIRFLKVTSISPSDKSDYIPDIGRDSPVKYVGHIYTMCVLYSNSLNLPPFNVSEDIRIKKTYR